MFFQITRAYLISMSYILVGIKLNFVLVFSHFRIRALYITDILSTYAIFIGAKPEDAKA